MCICSTVHLLLFLYHDIVAIWQTPFLTCHNETIWHTHICTCCYGNMGFCSPTDYYNPFFYTVYSVNHPTNFPLALVVPIEKEPEATYYINASKRTCTYYIIHVLIAIAGSDTKKYDIAGVRYMYLSDLLHQILRTHCIQGMRSINLVDTECP